MMRRYQGQGIHATGSSLSSLSTMTPPLDYLSQSEHHRLPQASHYEMMPLWVKRKILEETGGGKKLEP